MMSIVGFRLLPLSSSASPGAGSAYSKDPKKASYGQEIHIIELHRGDRASIHRKEDYGGIQFLSLLLTQLTNVEGASV